MAIGSNFPIFNLYETTMERDLCSAFDIWDQYLHLGTYFIGFILKWDVTVKIHSC